VLQRLVVGFDATVVPFDEPHTPFTGVGGGDCGASWAEQLAFVPTLLPAHDHVQGPEPATADAVPVLQRLVVGFDATVVPFDDPHTPFTGDGGGVVVVFCAVQAVLVPPFSPLQVHFHGPVPLMVEAVPALQGVPAAGFDASVAPPEEPHTPLIGGFTSLKVAVLWSTPLPLAFSTCTVRV